VVWSVPGKESQPSSPSASPKSHARHCQGNQAPTVGSWALNARNHGAAATGIERSSLKGAKRAVLDNGLTLLLHENRRLPIVVAEAFVRNTRLLEEEDKAGVAHLTGELLD